MSPKVDDARAFDVVDDLLRVLRYLVRPGGSQLAGPIDLCALTSMVSFRYEFTVFIHVVFVCALVRPFDSGTKGDLSARPRALAHDDRLVLRQYLQRRERWLEAREDFLHDLELRNTELHSELVVRDGIRDTFRNAANAVGSAARGAWNRVASIFRPSTDGRENIITPYPFTELPTYQESQDHQQAVPYSLEVQQGHTSVSGGPAPGTAPNTKPRPGTRSRSAPANSARQVTSPPKGISTPKATKGKRNGSHKQTRKAASRKQAPPSGKKAPGARRGKQAPAGKKAPNAQKRVSSAKFAAAKRK
ncbi:hypothetical protein CC1G_05440 [Coprinopsis cinerea okayama7|uniref:Uncharacterized protein n=1 Tax=Coprinopsis cinerea (strain Okayama-7 / 130 / ATCC MYA-4618 / FGSC 9003) TaxID=240176 RepID=A8NQ44_COPC7|nr:hypothetical protein CC1G_05440 [Coprinopsis cinerea okayama7\|eukprot:XP_001835478.2 hypothetical protein CC1G_05440 [Coprinopsis cinerea okayama7\